MVRVRNGGTAIPLVGLRLTDGFSKGVIVQGTTPMAENDKIGIFGLRTLEFIGPAPGTENDYTIRFVGKTEGNHLYDLEVLANSAVVGRYSAMIAVAR